MKVDPIRKELDPYDSENWYLETCYCGDEFETPYEDQRCCGSECLEELHDATGLLVRKCKYCHIEFKPRRNELFCGQNCKQIYAQKEVKLFWKKKGGISKNKFTIYERDNFKCIYCGKTTDEYDIVLSLDHIIPVSSGQDGLDLASNLITCCKSCNSAKNDKALSSRNIKFLKKLVLRRNKEIGLRDEAVIRFSR
jgi:5-methylcytosine-specific restriction endonuclease McrA